MSLARPAAAHRLNPSTSETASPGSRPSGPVPLRLAAVVHERHQADPETVLLYHSQRPDVLITICEQIRQLKSKLPPTATQEEVAYSVLDDYGLPSTPSEVSVFAASIGKRWDHGIAMESGIIQPKGEKLDPVRHFDLSRCTMVMQSQGMNWGSSRPGS